MLTLDELNDNDEVFQIGGLMFAVKKDLMKKISPVKIDYKFKLTGSGFVITSRSA